MGFIVNINDFEGPLDLMLHLVRENELDLFNLNISVLTDQYLSYINQMNDLQLEVESEYLVELATLIEYKSKKLLPKNTEELEGEYEEDPAIRLANRLIMYQKYKDVTEELNEQYSLRQKQYSKNMSEVSEEFIENNDYFNINGNPYMLMKAMSRALRRIQLVQPIEVKKTTKELSVDDRILQIKSRLAELEETFSFETLVSDCVSMEMFIVTFLAVLDLAKNQFLIFTIDEQDVIWFKRRKHNG